MPGCILSCEASAAMLPLVSVLLSMLILFWTPAACLALKYRSRCLLRSNLYDVFRNIAGDEREHVKTMKACRDYSIVSDIANRRLARPDKADAVSPVPETNGSAGVKTMDTTQLK
jgi:hypothetical protein